VSEVVCMCLHVQSSAKCRIQQTDGRQCYEAADSDNEDRIQNRMRQYERKIEMLLEQVAELEKEVSVVSKLLLTNCFSSVS